MPRLQRPRPVWPLLLVIGFGCSEERAKLETLEKEAVQAEAALADLRTHRDQLAQSRRDLEVKIRAGRKARDEARQSAIRTNAAYGLVALAQKPDMELDEGVRSAVRAVEFRAAASHGKLDEAAAVAAAHVLTRLPCAAAEDAQDADEGDACVSEPYADACQLEEETVALTPDWSCPSILKHADGLPASVFCVASADYPGDFSWAPLGLPGRLSLIRTATLHDGRLLVRDWPAPDFEVFNPRNSDVLATCARQTDENRCIFECDKQFDRYQDPCSTADMHEEYGDGERGRGGDENESAEVRQARVAAEEAERRAAEAAEDARLAQEEVQYQQCLSGCRETPEEAPKLVVEELSRLKEELAPGVYLVELDLTLSFPDRPVAFHTVTQLLVDPLFSDLQAGDTIDAEELRPLESLTLLGEAVDARGETAKPELQRLQEGETIPKFDMQAGVAKLPIPGIDGEVLVMTLPKELGVQGWRFSRKKGEPAFAPIAWEKLCAQSAAFPERWKSTFQNACDRATITARYRGDAGAAMSSDAGGTP